jgi:hypothetical protein
MPGVEVHVVADSVTLSAGVGGVMGAALITPVVADGVDGGTVTVFDPVARVAVNPVAA